MTDDTAFERELVRTLPRLRAFARSLALDAALADDLVQETMIKAWKARASFQLGTNMKAWTFLILRNVFYSLKRRSWREQALEPVLADEMLVGPASQDSALALDDLRRALSQLNDEQREALVLVGAAGLSYEEAAQITGCAIGTVKSRVSRARTALAAILDTGKVGSADLAPAQAMAALLMEGERRCVAA